MPQSRLSISAALTALLLVLDIVTSSCSTSGRSTNHWTAASKELADVIRTQEIGVWEALKKKDKAADRTLLADDFVGVYKEGVGNKIEHIAQIDADYQLSEYTLDHVRVLTVSKDAAMIVYRATCRATGTWANDCAQPMFISSLWLNRGDTWVNVFSQDTSTTTQPK